MNDLYLIGNGFDLAHGLETSYNHFLLWYLNDFLRQLWDKEEFDDKLMKIKCINRRYRVPSDFRSVSELLNWLEEYNYKKTTHEFFDKIILNYRDKRWVDIEYEYFSALVKLYKEIELNPQQKESVLKAVKRLNDCFDMIKKKLVEYLILIDKKKKSMNEEINKILFEGTGENGDDVGKKIYVYFNYSSTIDLYTKDKFKDILDYTVFIHGKLSEEIKQGEINPEKLSKEIDHIVFGYGDEIDPFYEKIENSNANEFLENIKSFDYLKTDDYQYVVRFLEEDKFCVKILGHSCGLSDRILLKTIFEHRNCKNIKIYYYKKEDYREKTQEISRHFGALRKAKMRTKIVPFEDSEPMPQNPKDN